MPKIFEYKGFVFRFYSNDHEPPHVHVEKAERKIKVEIIEKSGVISLNVIQKTTKGFAGAELNIIDTFIRTYCKEILEKWKTFFNGRKPKFQKIARFKKSR